MAPRIITKSKKYLGNLPNRSDDETSGGEDELKGFIVDDSTPSAESEEYTGSEEEVSSEDAEPDYDTLKRNRLAKEKSSAHKELGRRQKNREPSVNQSMKEYASSLKDNRNQLSEEKQPSRKRLRGPKSVQQKPRKRKSPSASDTSSEPAIETSASEIDVQSIPASSSPPSVNMKSRPRTAAIATRTRRGTKMQAGAHSSRLPKNNGKIERASSPSIYEAAPQQRRSKSEAKAFANDISSSDEDDIGRGRSSGDKKNLTPSKRSKIASSSPSPPPANRKRIRRKSEIVDDRPKRKLIKKKDLVTNSSEEEEPELRRGTRKSQLRADKGTMIIDIDPDASLPDDEVPETDADPETSDSEAWKNELPAQFSSMRTLPLSIHFHRFLEYHVRSALNGSQWAKKHRSDFAFSLTRLSDHVRDRATWTVTSQAWTPIFKAGIEGSPKYAFCGIGENQGEQCEACTKTDRNAAHKVTLGNGVDSYMTYDKVTLMPLNITEGSHKQYLFYVGRFCKKRSVLYHRLLHFAYHVVYALRERLKQVEENNAKDRKLLGVEKVAAVTPSKALVSQVIGTSRNSQEDKDECDYGTNGEWAKSQYERMTRLIAEADEFMTPNNRYGGNG